jgi:hypothetical protein
VGGGNIVIHSQKQRRYKCKCCKKSFSESYGTGLYRIKKASELFVLVVTLLSYGCPVQAIVVAFGLDERTVRSWLHKAGSHAQQVHEAMMSQQQLDLQQVQADEIRVKMQRKVLLSCSRSMAGRVMCVPFGKPSVLRFIPVSVDARAYSLGRTCSSPKWSSTVKGER